jgi:glycerophosphoryl diester phosphodiesterase
VSAFHLNLSAEVVAQGRRSGLAVYAWTADGKSEIQRLLHLDVDGVVTNYPERALLRRAARRP